MKKSFLKILSVCALVFATALTTSCNKQIFDTSYKFEKVHIIGTGCFKITSWTDFEDGDQIQVNIKDHGTCLFHSSQIILVEKKCPICGN